MYRHHLELRHGLALEVGVYEDCEFVALKIEGVVGVVFVAFGIVLSLKDNLKANIPSCQI